MALLEGEVASSSPCNSLSIDERAGPIFFGIYSRGELGGFVALCEAPGAANCVSCASLARELADPYIEASLRGSRHGSDESHFPR